MCLCSLGCSALFSALLSLRPGSICAGLACASEASYSLVNVYKWLYSLTVDLKLIFNDPFDLIWFHFVSAHKAKQIFHVCNWWERETERREGDNCIWTSILARPALCDHLQREHQPAISCGHKELILLILEAFYLEAWYSDCQCVKQLYSIWEIYSIFFGKQPDALCIFMFPLKWIILQVHGYEVHHHSAPLKLIWSWHFSSLHLFNTLYEVYSYCRWVTFSSCNQPLHICVHDVCVQLSGNAVNTGFTQNFLPF